jgi:hypothetical protein
VSCSWCKILCMPPKSIAVPIGCGIVFLVSCSDRLCNCHPYTASNGTHSLALPAYRALNATKASLIARFRLSSHHLACETGTWRRRKGPAGVNPTRCTWCSTAHWIVGSKMNTACVHGQHSQNLRTQMPLLFAMMYGRGVLLMNTFQ